MVASVAASSLVPCSRAATQRCSRAATPKVRIIDVLGMYEGLHASIVDLGRALHHSPHFTWRGAHHNASLICVLCSAPLFGCCSVSF